MFLSFATLREQGYGVRFDKKLDGVEIRVVTPITPESATEMHRFQAHFMLDDDAMDEIALIVNRAQLMHALREAVRQTADVDDLLVDAD